MQPKKNGIIFSVTFRNQEHYSHLKIWKTSGKKKGVPKILAESLRNTSKEVQFLVIVRLYFIFLIFLKMNFSSVFFNDIAQGLSNHLTSGHLSIATSGNL